MSNLIVYLRFRCKKKSYFQFCPQLLLNSSFINEQLSSQKAFIKVCPFFLGIRLNFKNIIFYTNMSFDLYAPAFPFSWKREYLSSVFTLVLSFMACVPLCPHFFSHSMRSSAETSVYSSHASVGNTRVPCSL